MENYSAKEIIEQAVQTEKLGHDFYVIMALRFEEDRELKELFETLAAEEMEHEKKFSGLGGRIEQQELQDWDEAAKYLRAIVESEFFLGTNKSLPSLEHMETVEDAVRFAVGFEKETLLYFLSMKEIIKEKEVIEQIVKEEKSHIVWLSEFRKKTAGR